jgi:WD40 repeat protein
VAVAPDGRWAVSGAALGGGTDPVVRVWDRKTGKELKRFQGHVEAVHQATIAPDVVWPMPALYYPRVLVG